MYLPQVRDVLFKKHLCLSCWWPFIFIHLAFNSYQSVTKLTEIRWICLTHLPEIFHSYFCNFSISNACVWNWTETSKMGQKRPKWERSTKSFVKYLSSCVRVPSDSISCKFISHDSVGAHETRGRTLTVFFVTVFPP